MDRTETICFCNDVTVGDIEDAVKKGAKSFDDVVKATEATTGCGGCEDNVRALVDKLLKKDGE